jgi:peptidoglycan L-alanyl-D-glutamate endopeptidase CwlK
MNQHLDKLEHCHARLKPAMLKVLSAMEALGFPMMVTDGIRSAEQQTALYAQGRTTPGPIVTYCDGVTKKSNHQSGRACDCCFIVDGQPSWDGRLPWATYGACLKAVGLRWGGSWESIHDLPHAEI